jgi:DNA primase
MNKGKPIGQVDYDDLLNHEVYLALFQCLDSAFPEFRWKHAENHWVATSWPPSFPFPVGHENPERLMVYRDRPYWIKVHGHGGVRFLDYVNGGQSPTGPDFPKAVKTLCEKSGVRFPEREYTPEELEKEAKRDRRRNALDAVMTYCQETLWSKRGTAARDYLVKERGLTEAGIKTLEIGLYTSISDVSTYLHKTGVDVTDTALLWPKLEGYIIFPWADANGQPLTLYGRWPGKPPEGRPKTIALPGEGTKASPLYFDRTRQAHQKDLILVEGVLDAAILQDIGDSRVMACVGAQLTGLQVGTLSRYRVSSVTICLDPDGGGERGTISCIESLQDAGIMAYVAPTLPDKMDPDEFVIKHGLDAWKNHIDRKIHALRYQADALIRKHKTGTEWTDAGLESAIDEAISFDAGIVSPENLTDLDCFFWSVIKEATGANETAIEGRCMAAREKQKRERERRDCELLFRTGQELAREGETNKAKELLREYLRTEELQSRGMEEPSTFSVDRLDQETKKLPKGLSSGWDSLDKLNVKFNPGELTVFGARTGHCKTAVMVNLVRNFLTRPDPEAPVYHWRYGAEGKIIFYSHEEPEIRIYHRLLAILTAEYGQGNGWTANQVRDFIGDPNCKGDSYLWPPIEILQKAKDKLRSWEDRLTVVYRPSWNVADLAAHCLRETERNPVGAVLVDYLQKISPPPGDYERRDIQVTAVARRLQVLSVEISAPVISGAQINREAIPPNYHSKLNGKTYEEAKKIIETARPQLDHLREGGSEQEAPLVLGLLNYAADFRTELGSEREAPPVSRLEIGTLKNRYGEVGKWAPLVFEGRFGWIRDRMVEKRPLPHNPKQIAGFLEDI